MSRSASSGLSTFPVGHVLALLRIILAPVFLVVVLDTTIARQFGILIVAVAGISDILDGRLARRYGTASDFGALLDLTADKIFSSVALVGLLALGRATVPIVTIILIREFSVMGLRCYAALYALVLPKRRLGVAKTSLLFIGVAVALVDRPGGLFLLWGAVILAVISGVLYAVDITMITSAQDGPTGTCGGSADGRVAR